MIFIVPPTLVIAPAFASAFALTKAGTIILILVIRVLVLVRRFATSATFPVAAEVLVSQSELFGAIGPFTVTSAFSTQVLEQINLSPAIIRRIFAAIHVEALDETVELWTGDGMVAFSASAEHTAEHVMHSIVKLFACAAGRFVHLFFDHVDHLIRDIFTPGWFGTEL